MSHIRTIIKLEDPDLRVSKDALMAVNTAAETFVEQFVQEAYTCCAEDRKKCLSYDHLANVVSKDKRYDFLVFYIAFACSDFVPERVKAEDALRERSAAGKGG
eukprot:XP_025980374.1 uncharacterized protein LOC112998531 [Glycine max]